MNKTLTYEEKAPETNTKREQFENYIVKYSLPGEEWKEIPATDQKYYVSNKGRVLSLCRTKPHILKPQIAGNQRGTGYYYVNINGYKRVNRLVAQAFLENPDNKPVVHHKDNNKLNNDVSNLAFTTYSENTREYYKYKQEHQKEQLQNE